MTEYILTCHTTGCENEGLPISLVFGPEVGNAMCGACSQEITDVVPPIGG